MNKLTSTEVMVIQMALQVMIEDNEAVMKDVKFPFTPQARKEMKEMLECAKSARAKIVSISGKDVQLDPYTEGDEKDFLTK